MYQDPTGYYNTAAQAPAFTPLQIIIWLVVVVLLVASLWKLFTKAGKPGWAAIVPIYNTVVLLEIVGRPIWWIVLMFIPLVNIVVAIIVLHDLSRSFGKGVGMTILNIFLPFIGLPVLAWGDAKYEGPAAAETTPTATA